MTGHSAFAPVPSPLGELCVVVAADGRLAAVRLPGKPPELPSDAVADPGRCAAAVRQLTEYFAGRRTAFDLALAPHGTPFQLAAWRALQTIPFGATVSYGEQARRLGRPTAVRAIGAANGRNPLPIVVPCHRVVGGDGRLVGFGGGLAAKRWLLDHEAAVLRRGTATLPFPEPSP